MELEKKRCVPCEGGAKPLGTTEAEKYLAHVKGWTLDGKIIRKQFIFKNFAEAMEFVNKVADLAEQEDHHPDIKISWNKVTLELWTHAINGLSENDFIVAAKVDAISS